MVGLWNSKTILIIYWKSYSVYLNIESRKTSIGAFNKVGNSLSGNLGESL